MKRFAAIFFAFCLGGCADEPDGSVQSTGSGWQLSAAYVSNSVMQSDSSIALALSEGDFVQMRDGDAPDLFARYRRMAHAMKLQPAPALYIDALDSRPLPQAAARFSHEGHGYVVVNQAALERWSEPQLAAVLGHELVHLMKRHVTAGNLAAAYNHPELSVAHELEADRIGSGPLGSCDPGALKEALEIVIESDERLYLSQNPDKGIDDYNGLAGSDHPHWADRKAAIDAMIAHPPAGCGATPS